MNIGTSTIETSTIETFEGKLDGYEEIDPNILRKDNHFRYTSSVYQKPGERKCSYGVVQKVNEDGSLMTNSFGDKQFPDWKIIPTHKYKQYRFYKRIEKKWTGLCLDCEGAVDENYFVFL